VVVARSVLANNALQGQGQGAMQERGASKNGNALAGKERDMREKEDKKKQKKRELEQERKAAEEAMVQRREREDREQQRRAKEHEIQRREEEEKSRRRKQQEEEEDEEESLLVPLVEDPPPDIFDFKSSAPGLFSSSSFMGDAGDNYFQQGPSPLDNNSTGMGLDLDFGSINGEPHMGLLGSGLSVGGGVSCAAGGMTQSVLGQGAPGLSLPLPLTPQHSSSSTGSGGRGGGEEALPPDRVWIRNWLPKSFEGFPASIVTQFVEALAEEGMVSVQDLLTAQALGQLTLEYFREIGIACKLGHYNRVISSLSKFK